MTENAAARGKLHVLALPTVLFPGVWPRGLALSFCPRPCKNGLQIFAEKPLIEHAVLLSRFLFTAASPLLLGLWVYLLASTIDILTPSLSF